MFSILYIVVALIGFIVIVSAITARHRERARKRKAQNKTNNHSSSPTSKTNRTYHVGEFFDDGEYSGMIISVLSNGVAGRYVLFDSGFNDYEVEELLSPDTFNSTWGKVRLPTIEELETISKLSERFLYLRNEYFPTKTHSITTDEQGHTKLYASKSFVDGIESHGRFFYDFEHRKRVALKPSYKDGPWENITDDYYYPTTHKFYWMMVDYFHNGKGDFSRTQAFWKDAFGI